MKLYLNVVSNKIIGVDIVNINDSDIELDVTSVEQFDAEVSNRSLELDEAIEQSVYDVFNNDKTNDYNFTIKHWVSNRSIGELIDMYNNGEIIKPDMQRNLIWDSAKCSRLIESVLMGLPIPPLFMIEVDSSEYELVDGLQRLSTFANYIYGYSWSGKKNTGKPCKLSSHVMTGIAGKSFSELTTDQQRILKRSTIPLIEFKQLEPDNNEAKYLIFERINTGSVKLSAMQIRKSLAYGNFMTSLYNLANSNKDFMSLFSNTSIKKDAHVEALLRIMAITEIYNSEYETKDTNIGKILNGYCEKNRNKSIEPEFINRFNSAIDTLLSQYNNKKNVCRKVIIRQGQPEYFGGLQITILEAMLGTIMNNNIKSIDAYEEKYIKVMLDMYEQFLSSHDFAENPFNYSTGTRDSINKRYKICEKILL